MFKHKISAHSLPQTLVCWAWFLERYKSHWKNKFTLDLILRIFSFYATCYQKESYNLNEGIYCIDCVSLNIDLRHEKSLQLSTKVKLISIFASHKSCGRDYLQFALILETVESDPDTWRIEKAPKNTLWYFHKQSLWAIMDRCWQILQASYFSLPENNYNYSYFCSKM